MNFILSIYRYIFCRRIFYRFNYHFYRIASRGIGVLNSESYGATGEEYLFKFLQATIPLHIVFDVGANTGEYTEWVKKYFPKASIYAFEPHPNTYKRLLKNTKDQFVKTYNLALGENNRLGKLWDFADDAVLKSTQPTSNLSSLQKDVISRLHQQKSMSFLVKVTTLDDFMKKEKIERISLLKIDTEGTEFDVLLGAKEALKRGKIDIIQFEFNEMNVYSRVFMKDFVDLLVGFTFYRLMPNGLYPMGEYRPSTWEIFAFQNIVAIHKSVNISIIE